MIGAELIVDTSDGPVRGSERAGVRVFLGLPFAAPPVGPLRFRSPELVRPWATVREATAAGPSAPQVLSGGSAWIYENDGNPDEDCLYLNVWTPALSGTRPVMVWLHGGAFRSGHAALPAFDGTRLARDGDVVVVTVNYRLGALGWLAHPDLADPSTGATANWGLQDQVAALRWVQANVEGFGGDPANVTLFGESAGAVSLAHLAGNPANAGLFHKVIAQSRSWRQRYAADPAVAREYTAAVAASLGVDVAGLRDVPVRALMAEEVKASREPRWSSRGMGATTVEDGLIVLKEKDASPIEMPVLAGTNRNESVMWLSLVNPGGTRASSTPPLAAEQVLPAIKALLANNPLASGLEPAAVLAGCQAAMAWASTIDCFHEIYSDFVFRAPTAAWAAAQTACGQAAYVFEFAHQSPIPGLGTPHTLEIPFVFGTFGSAFMAPRAGAGAEEAALSRLMRASWARFAWTGNPSTLDSGEWPGYDALRREVMVLGGAAGPARVVAAPRESTRSLWDGVYPNSD